MKSKLLPPIILIFLATCVLAQPADCDIQRNTIYPGPKDYRLENATLKFNISPDGTVDVTESITYDFFSGKFSFAYRDIQVSPHSLSDVYVAENNNVICYDYLPTYENKKIRIKWYYNEVNNRKRTFTIHYKLRNIINAYDDVNEFHWKIWGSGWDKPLNNLYGEIKLPYPIKNSSEVYTWGHPELKGKIAMLRNDTVIFQTSAVPPHQWVEVRLTYPRYGHGKGIYANHKTGDGLEKIIKEEQEYSPSLQVDVFESFMPLLFIVFILVWVIGFLGPIILLLFPRFRDDFGRIMVLLMGIIVSLFLIIFLSAFLGTTYLSLHPKYLLLEVGTLILAFTVCWHLWGREPKVDYIQLYERDPPYNYSPAVVSALINQLSREPDESTLMGEILDLASKKYISIKKIKKEKFLGLLGRDYDFEITFNEKKVGEHLPASEKKLLSFLKRKAKGNPLTFTQLEKKIRKHPTSSQKWFKKWRKIVKKDAEGRKFFDKGTGVKVFVAVSLIIALVFFIYNSFISLFLTGILVYMLVYLFPQILPKRTPEGTLHYLRWMNLKKFLEDFSSLSTVSPDAVILWEKYLVYATALEVSKEVSKVMDKVFAGLPESSGVIVYGGITGSDFGGLASDFSSVGATFSSSFAGSSSTSGSGGFGGGGGSGGGGGGGGAG